MHLISAEVDGTQMPSLSKQSKLMRMYAMRHTQMANYES
jgi:hypothetical protein